MSNGRRGSFLLAIRKNLAAPMVLLLLISIIAAKEAHAQVPPTYSPLVTGNGFGFAVLSPEGAITKLYAHPYRFVKPNRDVSQDGVSTTNLINFIGTKQQWQGKNVARQGSASPTAEVKYIDESQVLSVELFGDSNSSRSGSLTYFMPFRLKRNALVLFDKRFLPGPAHGQDKTSPKDAATKDEGFILSWAHPVKTRAVRDVSGRKVELVSFTDAGESVAIVPLADFDGASRFLADSSAAERHSADLSSENNPGSVESLPGASWALVVLESEDQLDNAVAELVRWQGNSSLKSLIQSELDDFETWRVKPKVRFANENERKLWRQSETILRMAQIEEENTEVRFSRGLILASLPDGVWFTPWVRDMAYSVVALAQMGHQEEARQGILAWFNAHPVGRWRHETRNADYQISVVRYFGDGSEEADYSGLQTPNIELDDWGLALWAVSEYVKETDDTSILSEPTYRNISVYESMKEHVVKPLLQNLDPYGDGLIVAADSSLWEEHQQNKRHYASSTIAAIAGLRGFQQIARIMNDEAALNLVASRTDELEKGFKNAFVHEGSMRGSVEPSFKNEIDGSLAEALYHNLIEDKRIRKNTIEKFELLKMPSGGYRRVRGPSEYEAHEFLFINFNLARHFFRAGNDGKAQEILDRMVKKSCLDHGLIPEMYVSRKGTGYSGEIGQPTGSIPMVGFGAGDYIMTLVERERASRQVMAQ